jgi:hypothetical protein
MPRTPEPSLTLLEAVAVTAELCGRAFSPAAAAVFVADLSAHPEAEVLRALNRCRKEVRGVLTTHDVLSRIDDGRPGVETAWSMVPTGEWQSVVWTTEAAEAYGQVAHLVASGDKVAARMAFKESYQKLVDAAREAGRPVSWVASLGFDKEVRSRVLQDAVKRGLLTSAAAHEADPLALPAPEVVALLTDESSRKERGAEARELIEAAQKRSREADPLRWAKDLRDAESAGGDLTAAQREKWRAALLGGTSRQPIEGEFTPIPVDALPPAMRASHEQS